MVPWSRFGWGQTGGGWQVSWNVGAVDEVFPENQYQRCSVHFFRNIFAVTPRSRGKLVTKIFKAIYAHESKNAAQKKTRALVGRWLTSITLIKRWPATLFLANTGTNNVIERLNRNIRRRTRGVDGYPRWIFGPYAGRCPAAPVGRYPLGQQEVREHEAHGGSLWESPYCWLTSFIPKTAN